MSENIKKTILVPTDFSEACDNALNHAIELSKYLKCEIYVLHVISKDTLLFMEQYRMEYESIVGKEEENDKTAIVNQRLAAYLEKKKISNLVPITKEGDIFTTIAEVAEQINAKFIILGTHGKIGFQRITGSYALKVIDSTEVPVIAVQRRLFGDGYKNIVFPISLNDADRQKAKYAVQIAKVFNSVIHIFPKSEDGEMSKTKISNHVLQLKEIFSKQGVSFKEINSADYGEDFDKQILNYSAAIIADLILIMSDPEKHGVLFGSKEENIIFNAAQIPVMCINTQKVGIKTFWAW